MDPKQITRLGRNLMDLLSEFDDYFGRSEPREHLRTYVRGQLQGSSADEHRADGVGVWDAAPDLSALRRIGAVG